MKDKIVNYMKAGYPALYIVTHEEARVSAIMTQAAEETECELFSWSVTEGITNAKGESEYSETQNPSAALTQAMDNLKENSILYLRDLHMFLEERNAVICRQLRDVLAASKASLRTLVIVG